MYIEDDMTKDRIFAEALIQIIENQVQIKKHLGIVSNTSYYEDCYHDGRVIEYLETIK
jgi:hypothetical protein